MKPMLAHDYLKHGKKVSSWDYAIVQPKFDGIRATFKFGQRHFLSRNEKPLYNQFLANRLNEFLSGMPAGMVLDGELIVPGEDFNTIASIVKRSITVHPRDNEVAFVAFDFYIPACDWGTHDRLTWLHNRVEVIPLNSVTTFAKGVRFGSSPHLVIDDPLACEQFLEPYAEAGWEGIMLRNPNTPYEVDKRSYNLLKLKAWKTLQAHVYDIVPGKGKQAGMMGALACVFQHPETKEVIHFEVGTGFTDGDRQAWWHERYALKHPNIIVKYQELSTKGVPRFPVYQGFAETDEPDNL